MRNFILLLAISLFTIFQAAAQEQKIKAEHVDKLRLTFGGSVGVVPVKFSGITDIGTGESGYYGQNPVYALRDSSGFLMHAMSHAGITVPFLRTKSWSVGVALNAGVGYLKNFKSAENLEGKVFDLPQFVYYRNYGSKLDFALMLGYKYTQGLMPYQMVLGALEVNVAEVMAVRVYGSLNGHKTYRSYTDGRTETAGSINEFGLTLVSGFHTW